MRTVVFDFTTATVGDYEAMYAAAGLAKLDVGVLVNNVGMANEHPDYSFDASAVAMRNILVVNDLSVVTVGLDWTCEVNESD